MRKDYNTIVKEDPIELLNAIEQEVHNYQDTRYDMAVMTQALKGVLNLKQHDEGNWRTFCSVGD